MDTHLLRQMFLQRAQIFAQKSSYPGGEIQYLLIPYGDRRRRPIAWPRPTQIKKLIDAGILIGGPDKYVLAPGTALIDGQVVLPS